MRSRAVAVVLMLGCLSAFGHLCAAQTPDNAKPPSHIDEITVMGDKALDKAVHEFIGTFAAPTPFLNQLARWADDPCPAVYGMTSAYGKFIVDRMMDIAAEVGANPKPANGKAPTRCEPNIKVIFSHDPQGVLDDIRVKNPLLLGYHYISQTKEVATVSQPIQAWYETQTEDMYGHVVMDCAQFLMEPCPRRPPRFAVKGHMALGLKAELGFATIVVDENKIAGTEIGAVADYTTMLALAQAKSFDTCRVLPSISNLFSPNCDEEKKPHALTPNDMAYLRALYATDPEGRIGEQRLDMKIRMTKDLENR